MEHFVYGEGWRLENNSNLVANVLALRLRLEYCIEENLIPLIRLFVSEKIFNDELLYTTFLEELLKN